MLHCGVLRISSNLSSVKYIPCVVQSAGLKYFPPPIKYDGVEFPERTRLKFVDKVPQFPPSVRPPKMVKNLKFMRGPEELHNFLVHKQYGIIALGGGRLRWGHFEMIRLGIIRKMDSNRMFGIWRVDPPWQPVTKKGQGHRMGGGKGAIDHYVTPVKAGRVIVEVGGKCEFAEVRPMLEIVAHKLPFKAQVVSEEMMIQAKQEEERQEKDNINPYTFKYVVQNNMGGCHKWISTVDKKWFGKFQGSVISEDPDFLQDVLVQNPHNIYVTYAQPEEYNQSLGYTL